MTIKKRTATLITGTTGGSGTGTATIDLGLGFAYAEVLRVEFKGDDANVDTNNTFAITDAEGRSILDALALDAGTDDSSVKATSQSFSTVGVARSLTSIEAEVVDRDGDASADTEGLYAPLIAKSPITIDLAAGTDGDVHQVNVFVRG